MKFSVIEFFVGAGGSHLGFMKNGFETLYVNDFDQNALKTLTFNNPSLKNAIIDDTDITKISPKSLKKRLKNGVDVSFGGIVCKGFSLAGERSPADARNQFYRYYLDIVSEIRPKISVIENVKGMLGARILGENTPGEIWDEVSELYKQIELFRGAKSALRKQNKITPKIERNGQILRQKKQNLLKKIEPFLICVVDDIRQIYEKMGYRVSYKILNAAWYGAATKRERLIIVAVRDDLVGDFKFPLPKFYDENIGTRLDFDNLDGVKFKKPISVGEALSKIDYSDKNDQDNMPMNHDKKTVERFRHILPGGNLADVVDKLPRELQITKFYSRGGNMRLDFNATAPTLVPGHSAFPLHPSEHRSISVREAATITGFPLDYKFFGSHTKRCEQVGNAVPPPLSSAIAKAIKDFLSNQAH